MIPHTTKEVALMENTIVQVADSIPTLIEHTHLNIELKGWPAAITAIGFFLTCAALYAIHVAHPSAAEASEGEPSAASAL